MRRETDRTTIPDSIMRRAHSRLSVLMAMATMRAKPAYVEWHTRYVHPLEPDARQWVTEQARQWWNLELRERAKGILAVIADLKRLPR